MVKLGGPFVSAQAGGSLGKTVTVAKWKGRSYMKKLTQPAQPQSGLQVGSRSMLRFLSTNFGTLSAADILTWADLAEQRRISAYNAWVSYNMERWSRMLAPTKDFPAAETDDPADISLGSATAGLRTIDLEWTAGEGLDNWGIVIFRSTSTGFTPAADNVIRVDFWDADSEPDFNWTDGPLAPATYYYRMWIFAIDGNLSKLWTDEESATIS